jgi:hypothetical protein
MDSSDIQNSEKIKYTEGKIEPLQIITSPNTMGNNWPSKTFREGVRIFKKM